MDEKKFIEDSPRDSDISTDIPPALAMPPDIQSICLGVLIAQLSENLAWTLTSINLHKNILATLGFGSKDEIDAHVKRTYETWLAAISRTTQSAIDELSRYEGLDPQTQENQ